MLACPVFSNGVAYAAQIRSPAVSATDMMWGPLATAGSRPLRDTTNGTPAPSRFVTISVVEIVRNTMRPMVVSPRRRPGEQLGTSTLGHSPAPMRGVREHERPLAEVGVTGRECPCQQGADAAPALPHAGVTGAVRLR